MGGGKIILEGLIAVIITFVESMKTI